MRRIVIKKETPSKVKTVLVSARKLAVLHVGAKPSFDIPGLIAWVKPQKGDTQETVAAYAESLRAKGAAVALPMPMASEDAAVPAEVHESPVAAGLGVRAIVEELLSKVKEMPEKVRDVTEQAMSKAGL